MSQNAIALPTTGTLPGATGVADMNAAYLTLATLASGASAPTTGGLSIGSTAGVFWHDTGNNVLNIRNQADNKWITLFHLDETNGVATPNTPVSSVSTAQTISGSSHFANLVFTGSTARTFTLARANTLWNGFAGSIFNESSAQLTLTPNAADNFNSGTTGAGIVVSPGYVANFVTDAATAGTWWTSVEPATLGAGSIASVSTCDIGSVGFENVTVSGTTTITSLGATAVVGQVKDVTFSGALTLTYNATSLILPGAANIITAAGDTARFQCLGSGNWRCLVYQPASGNPVIAAGGGGYKGGFKNLKILVTSNTAASISYDELAVENSSNQYVTLRSGSLTLGTGSTGANGLDTGTLTASTWYYLYAIWNGTTQASLISTSATAPTLPSTYTHSARVGAVRTDGSANLMRTLQYGRSAQYVVTVATNTAALPTIITGSAGSTSTPTWIGASVSSLVPATACRISGVAYLPAGTAIIIAPNNGYGGTSSTTNPPIAGAINGTNMVIVPFEFSLESTSVYYAGTNAGEGTFCLGWEDNL